MGHLNNIISKPVDVVGDIAYVLGSSSGDLGTLCTLVDGEQKWSWHKPIRSSNPALDISSLGPTDTLIHGDAPSGQHAIGGLLFPYAQTLGTISISLDGKRTPASGSFFDKLMRGQLDWTYLKPRGSANNEFFRAFDFVSFVPDALSPQIVAPSGSEPVSPGGAATLILSYPYTTYPSGNMLLSNMHVPSAILGTTPLLNTFYAGLLFYKSDYSDMFWQTSDYPLNAGTVESKEFKVSLNGVSDRVGTWKVRPFLSYNPLDFCEVPETGTQVFVAADHEEQTMVLVQSGTHGELIVTFFSAKWVQTTGPLDPDKFRVQMSIENNYATTAVLSDCELTIECAGGLDVHTQSYANQTLASGDTFSFNNLFTNCAYLDGVVTVTFSCNVTVNGSTESFEYETTIQP